MNAADDRGTGYVTSAGALLRDAREAAGWSLDAVAQQLKLAPRQVRAIEEDDYALLPGRTFVRGFVRNYARLVGLDPDAVLATLPRGEATSPLERLTYSPGAPPMGELPAQSDRRGKSPARWLIPLLFIAIVAAAAYYEYGFPMKALMRTSPDAPTAPPRAVPSAPAGQTSMALPNPLDTTRTEAQPAAAAPAQDKSPPAPTSSAPAADTTAMPAATASPATAAGSDVIALTWKGPSWVEVRDAAGTPLLMQTGTAGTTQSVTGTAPFEVVIGNASNVGVTWHGEAFDLTPHTRYNVARFSLK